LEHSRIFWWRNGGDDLVYSGSADWMPRNLNRRIEVVFPILDPEAKRRVMHDVLGTAFRDNTFSWELQSDGNYVRRSPGDAAPVRAQQVFVERVNGRGKTSRTTLRPEVPVKRFTSPAARVAEAQRRRSGGDIDNDTFIEKKKS
jgi:polyphosphate kinase